MQENDLIIQQLKGLSRSIDRHVKTLTVDNVREKSFLFQKEVHYWNSEYPYLVQMWENEGGWLG
jgi:hypothetical protein